MVGDIYKYLWPSEKFTSFGGAPRHAGTEIDEEIERRFDGHQEMIHREKDFQPLKVKVKYSMNAKLFTFNQRSTLKSCSNLP